MFGSYGCGRVYIASRARTTIFTHPIFESDFDCLTGKNHLHAQSLLSPIASDKHETFKKIKYALLVCILYHFLYFNKIRYFIVMKQRINPYHSIQA